MERKFMVEWRIDGPIKDAKWYLWSNNMTYSQVKEHALSHQIQWQKGLCRLTELVPIQLDFNTEVIFKEIK